MTKLIWFLLALLPFSSFAKVAANVPADYSNYRHIDRLEAYGCANPTFRAFRPGSHSDLRDALVQEEEKRDRDDGGNVPKCTAPAWLLKERDILLRGVLQNDARAGLLLINDDRVPLNGIDASVSPTFPLRAGRPYFYGPNLYGEGTLNSEGGHGFGVALSLTPGWIGGLEDYRSLRGRFYLHEGYIKVGYGRVEVTFGRTLLGFGAAKHGSLILSEAAKPLNLWKFALRPAWKGEALGPFSLETWIADQGTETGVKGAKLWGIGIGARPFPFLELSLLELYQFGGAGAPTLATSDYFSMLTYSHDDKLTPKRQRGMGIDIGIWGPSRYAKLYGQLFFDKFAKRWFSEEASTLVGLWFPKIGETEVRLEFVNVAPNAYQSSFWTQGFTSGGSPLGHPVGPGGEALYVDVGLPALDEWRPGIGLPYEKRGKSLTGALRPESRYGGGIECQRRWLQTEISAVARFVHAENYLYQPRQNSDAVSLSAMLRYSFL